MPATYGNIMSVDLPSPCSASESRSLGVFCSGAARTKRLEDSHCVLGPQRGGLSPSAGLFPLS